MAIGMCLLFPLQALAESCSYSFSLDAGKKYPLEKIDTFVTGEIRPLLNNSEKLVSIEIHETCAGKAVHIDVIKMDTQNYYLIEINDQKLPGHIVRYNNRIPLDINRETLTQIISEIKSQDYTKYPRRESARTYKQIKEVTGQQRILKMLAFIFAEAARFESVEIAVRKTKDGACSINWQDFDFAVHNWYNSSEFIKAKSLVLPFQIEGGGDSEVLAPITLEQEQAFEKALLAGERFRFSKEAPFYEYEYECK